MDTLQFIQTAKTIHGDKYDYSEAIYINNNTKVNIICVTCNTHFEQIPYNHINKKAGCSKCALTERYKKTLNIRRDEFIQKAKEAHGNKYNYSKVIYINSKTPVVIICNVCDNEFEQMRNTHLTGDGGCKECIKINLKKKMTFTKEQFIQKAKEVHHDKYDYSLVDYIDSQTHITIICNYCNNKFQQIPNGHIQGRGCRLCANKLNGNKMRKTKEQFILEAKKIHTDENNNPIYDYSLVDYNTTNEKVIIICKIHGRFEQCPAHHLRGSGCGECGKIKRAKAQTFSKEFFIQKAKEIHGDGYDYSQVNYINSQTHVNIICNTCGNNFPQVPNSHLRGCGCDKCAHRINHENQKLSEDELIERAKKVHGDKFDYPNINYINSHTPINIKCNKCGDTFQQLYPNHIKQNKGCPYCDCRITEKIMLGFLRSKFPDTVIQYKENWCKNKKVLPFDFYIPSLNLIIELDGNQHFIQVMNWKSPEENQETDIHKMNCANKHNLSVIRIVQTDVLYNTYDWREELLKNIEKIKIDNIIQNIYMCKNNEYENYPIETLEFYY